MTIVHRLIVTLGVALCALAAVGGYGLYQLHASYQRIEGLETQTIPGLREISRALDETGAMRFAVYRYVVDGVDDATRAASENEVDKADGAFDKALADYEAHYLSDEDDRRMLETDRMRMAAYRAQRTLFFQRIQSGDRDGALTMLHDGGDVHNTALAVNNALHAHVNEVIDRVNAVRDENASAYRLALVLMLGAVGAALIVTGLLGTHLYRIVSVGLGGLRGTLEAVSRTLDLSRRIHVEREDEIGKTAIAVNNLLDRMMMVVSDVRASSDTVGVASKQIAAGNLDLSTRTEEQAASLQQTASSITDLTETVRRNVDDAHAAKALASSSTRMSDEGSKAVERLVGTMNDISGNSARIAEITSLIDGIAFQTNLLSLNAAVEAARAGEQGRGFSVVATEVRNLARRSADAAREIKHLVDRSVATIRSGSQQAEEAGRATEEVRLAIHRVATIVDDIATASDAQRRGIDEVNQAVIQIDSVTQQNAALVEQAAAAARSLDDQVAKLSDSVSLFQIERVGEAAI
ncbi:methyl-accepting chemotaxis protein [Paraburkholderia sp. J12]|uniref:methyl-accepting chemotaxis protein n=1 Tax=Paraburkholderia sp. J12 TaxID=2805432 RepID=UPI002ABD6302|nr:methyl-accepting chemotaxis protein [Paraburkholderia sp. J12]